MKPHVSCKAFAGIPQRTQRAERPVRIRAGRLPSPKVCSHSSGMVYVDTRPALLSPTPRGRRTRSSSGFLASGSRQGDTFGTRQMLQNPLEGKKPSLGFQEPPYRGP
jgi:hypothetical protein